MGYVVGLGLQNPELKILFQLDILLLHVKLDFDKNEENKKKIVDFLDFDM